MAFVTTPVSGFLGTTTVGRNADILSAGVRKQCSRVNTPTMSETSSNWRKYAASLSAKNAPTITIYAPVVVPKFTRPVYISLQDMMADIKRRAHLFRRSNKPPKVTKADSYMAGCVTKQYKEMACSNGLYGVKCTEGTTRGMAEETRVISLATGFRRGTRDMVTKYGDMFESRKMAIVACHGCSYEEKLVGSFKQVASTMVTGQSEADGVCARYADSPDPAEQYMIACVDKQNKFRAVSGGLYGVMCQDASVSGMAETKRTIALAAKFRAGQLPKIVIEQNKFNARMYGRERYAAFCEYEEGLFNKYPGTAMAMRPQMVRH